jgi:hypothetical protein
MTKEEAIIRQPLLINFFEKNDVCKAREHNEERAFSAVAVTRGHFRSAEGEERMALETATKQRNEGYHRYHQCVTVILDL